MKLSTISQHSKFTPAPNAHKMVQRMAINRRAPISKTALKAHPEN